MSKKFNSLKDKIKVAKTIKEACMVLVKDTVKQRKLLKSSTHVTQTIFKNVKHIDGSKTKLVLLHAKTR